MDRPRRLLVLSSTYPRWKNDPEPGFVHELARRLTDEFEVHVVCPHSRFAKRRETLERVNVLRYQYAPARFEKLVHDGGILANLRNQPIKWLLVIPFLISQALATYRAVKTLKPDAVHAHWIIPQGLVYAIVASAMKSPPPMLVTSHGADLFALQSRFQTKLKEFALQKAAKATVVSRSMARKAVELNLRDDKVSVVSMGVDFDSLFVPNKQCVRSRNELLFVGRLVEKKGVGVLLESLPNVIESRSDTVLNIAGYGPMEHRLRQVVKETGLARHVNFLGATTQAELATLYRRAALLVAPFIRSNDGDQDGLGLVAIEAIACECPVLVSDLPFAHDILDPENDTKFLAPAGLPREWSTRILSLLSDQDSLVDDVRMLRCRLARRFSWNAVAGEYQRILEDVVCRHQARHRPE